MKLNSSPDSLTRFVPGTLLDWSDEYNEQSDAPSREVHVGALMITDISGFTRLTAKLSRDGGSAGAENISEVLNTFVTRLVALTEQHGGRILSYEGDSIVAGWKAATDLDLARTTWRACHCAHVLQQRAGRYDVGGEKLTIRSGVAAGSTHLLHVMGRTETRRVILTGAAVDEVLRCTQLAESGEVLVSTEAWARLGTHAEGRVTDNGPVRLDTIGPPPEPEIAPTTGPPSPALGPERYLLPGLRSRLASSLSRWLGELRTVTVAFVRMGEANLFDDLDRLDEKLATLNAEISRFNGDILRIDACDGELRILVVFGLPGRAHRDDPRRAVLAALALHSAARHDGTRLSIGVATGEAFCGAIGAPHRAEYTVIGEAVNRGSRLSSTSAGRILVDETTAQEAAEFATFEGPWPIQVAGLRAPVRAFIAIRPIEPSRAHASHELVGREREVRFLNGLLNRIEDPRTQPVVLAGDAGVGKSALVETFMSRCTQQGAHVFYGAADETEHGTPYFVFRPILRRILKLQERKGEEALAAIKDHLKSRQELLPLVPLLRDLFDLGPDEMTPIDQLAGSSRSENLRRLLLDIVLDPRRPARSVLVLEDIHWADGASRALISDLAHSEHRIAIVLTTRDLSCCREMFRKDAFSCLLIKALDRAGTLELVQRSLKTDELAPSVSDFIWNHTAGNPFFVAELCRVIDQRRPSLVPHDGSDEDLSVVTLPRSARAAVLSRTDRLPADEQVLLKIASATGVDFSTSDLRSIDVVRATKMDVEACVHNLLELQLLKRAANAPDRMVFGHAIIREVVYESMLLEQRKDVHAAIARSHEAHETPEVETLPFILNQWQRSGDRKKILEYLDQVAELRLRQFDNEAAIGLIAEFLKLSTEDGLAVPENRCAIAHLIVGEANLNLGKVGAALEAYREALRLIGLPLPRTSVALLADIAHQVAGLAWRRVSRPAAKWIDTTEVLRAVPRDDPFIRAAKAHQDLTQIYYFRSEKARLLHATLRATNMAERYPRLTPVLAGNYASLGAICGVIPLRRQARTYLSFASRVAKRVSSPATDAQVHLLTGLYETSVAEWRSAQRHFVRGLEQATRLGDWRRWSEIAVSLETITSPWFLTPIYSGEAAWVELVESIRSTGKRRDDLQVLGCGLVAGLRGYTVLGNSRAARECLTELRALVEEHSSSIEMIHRLEAAAYLARDALERGPSLDSKDWLERASFYLGEINPAMKSRTLPALSALFATAIRFQAESDDPDLRALCGSLARDTQNKLTHFARVFPIGRPRACLCCGDLAVVRGETTKAVRLWRRALRESVRWEMPIDGCEALKRLRATNPTITGEELKATMALRGILPARAGEWRELMEASLDDTA